MEVLFAWERGIPVVIINKSGKPLSPWLIYHSDEVVDTIPEAVMMAPLLTHTAAQRDVIKRERLDHHHVGDVLR
jgi:hypothetical protein